MSRLINSENVLLQMCWEYTEKMKKKKAVGSFVYFENLMNQFYMF